MVTTNNKSLELLPGTLRARFTVYDNSLDDRLLYHTVDTKLLQYYIIRTYKKLDRLC